MTYAIAAAGTGGHVYPALAVAHRLVAEGIAADRVIFIGGDRLEATVVPEAGFRLVRVEMRGLRRSLTPANLALPRLVLRAARVIERELRRLGTRVLLGMGGYVAVPAALAARRAGVPIVIHEQNARAGLANRLVSRWAERTLEAFPESGLRGAETVGNPLREELTAFDAEGLRPAALERYGLDAGLFTLGVLGGSLGAAPLNEAVADLVTAWDRDDLQIVHLAGRVHADRLAERAGRSALAWRIVPFEPAMAYFYAAADLVLSRAGALTVSELAATGTPSVLVPPGRLRRLNQHANAQLLEERGAAELLAEEDLSLLPELVARLARDPEGRAGMASAARSAARPGATHRVAEVLEEVAGG